MGVPRCAMLAALFASLPLVGALGCEKSMLPGLENNARSILVQGGWKTSAQCDHMTPSDKLQAIIVEMVKYSNKDVSHYKSISEDSLIADAAAVITLLRQSIRTAAQLTQMDGTDQRNALIKDLSERLVSESWSKLNKHSTWGLVMMAEGYFHQYCQVSAILDMSWNLDESKIVSKKPVMLTQETYDNSGSTVDERVTFTISKTVSEESDFSYAMGLTFSESATWSFGVPFVAEGKVTISSSQSFNWRWDTKNTQTTSFTQSTPMTIPPGKKIQMIAKVTHATMDVGYKATIRTATNATQHITGVWHGVSVYDLEVTQQDLPVSVSALV